MLRTLKLAMVLVCAAMLPLPAAAQAIKLGELNSYKTFPAFLEPYKKGMDLAVEDEVVTRMAPGLIGGSMDFLQLRARYRVAGRVGARPFDFEAPGAAETFRGR